jgi:hypothetical protein
MSAEPNKICGLLPPSSRVIGLIWVDPMVLRIEPPATVDPDTFVVASFAAAQQKLPVGANLVTFAIIGSGALGALVGGWSADRWGRTVVTSLFMVVSGCCAILIGFTFGAAPVLTILVGIIWGVAVIADSAQFSASVAELCDAPLRGTMLNEPRFPNHSCKHPSHAIRSRNGRMASRIFSTCDWAVSRHNRDVAASPHARIRKACPRTPMKGDNQ